MFNELERRNRRLWEGHSTILQDATHVIGGVGLGLLICPAFKRNAKAIGWAMVMLSAAGHIYADTVKPRRDRPPMQRTSRRRMRQVLPL